MTKPITDEQVDRLIESLPPMYDKDFKQSFKNCINQTRNQAFKEVLELKLMEDEDVSEVATKSVFSNGQSIIMANVRKAVNRGIRNELKQELRASIKELGENK